MRVLIAMKRPPGTPGRQDGGAQTWARTVRDSLIRLGHDVDIWGPGRLKGRFDLAIIQQIGYVRPVLNFARRSVLICHGIVEDERPEAGCDVTVFVSEGVRDHWGMDGPIIRQPIDLDFWKPGDRQRAGLIRYSHRKAPVHGKAVADALGMDYLHMHDASPEGARLEMQSAACVLASGRAALEAMACGAPTVIYDHRKSYQGPLMGLDMESNMANSYAGRGGYAPTVDDVVHACRQEMKLGSPRPWVENHHDSRKVVEHILALV